MDYLSFDLRIGEWSSQTHRGVVEVLHCPSGEGRRFPFILEVDVTSVLRSLAGDPTQPRRFGRLLANAIFRHEIALAWYESYQIARERRCGLRLRLHIESWELSRLPWELLFDTRADEFMAFDERVSITRYIRLSSAPAVLRRSGTLRILAISASPVDEAPLSWQNEIALLREAVDPLVKLGRVHLDTCEHATREKLHVALVDSHPDVVHFVGHGEYDMLEQQGYLLMEDDRHRSVYMNAVEVARLLRRYGTNVVILNACETARGIWAGLAPTLVRSDIPAVVAMQWPIEDRAAVTFSKAFYRTLASGRTVDECVSEGRVAMDAAIPHSLMWAAPVLFIRSMNGQLWTPDQSSEPPADRREEGPSRASGRQPASAPDAKERIFRTRGPLRMPEDREIIMDRPELGRALQIARQPAVSQYLAILSARQTGKTTLLLQLMDELRDRYACAFIDLSVLRGQDSRDCFRLVGSQLAGALADCDCDVASLGATPDNPVAFLDYLQRLAQAVPVLRIVLMMDEVGALSPQVSDTFFNTVRTIFTQGRGLRNALAKYLFVFSGAVDLYGLTFGTNSPLNICEKIYLEDLAPQQVERLVSAFSQRDTAVAADVGAAIYALTSGHPYLSMRLCSLMEDAQPARITAQTVQRAAAQILVEDDNLRHLIQELESQPGARRHLRSIVIEGQSVPFSRNNPILAALEMMGAIRPGQPCSVRNALYERALREYYSLPAHAEGSGRPSASSG
ncbi:MAG: CHAT domain-containing protein [Chloroflexi bacterium]|nr:CHAT domain-containing protein [Chloroflexota bacterium]